MLAAFAALAIASPASAALVVNEVDYDQVSTDTAEFAEIRNNGDAAVGLDPFALRLVNGNAGGAVVYNTIDLPAVSLEPGDLFVVCANAATVPNCDLDADPSTDFIQNGSPDAVAIVEGDSVVDTLSYEGNTGAPYTETAGTGTGVTGADSNSVAFIGLSRAPGGLDTGNNATDFVIRCITPGTPNSLASTGCTEPSGGGGGDEAPRVTAVDPPNNASDVAPGTNVVVTFSEPVDATDAAFELTCGDAPVPTAVTASEDGTEYTLDPATDLPTGTECIVRVRAAGVSDRDTEDPPDRPSSDFTSRFTTEALTGLRIHDIQGSSHISPYRDRVVAGVTGVVTLRRTNGYFVQDPRPDGDSRTSEGIFVFTGSAPDAALTPGTAVTLSGEVSEFRAGGASSANLTNTELTGATALPAGTGTIAPTLVGRGGRVPPTTVVEDDVVDPGGEDPTAQSGDVEQGDPLFDPQEDGIDFYESLEGMLTEVRNATVVGPTTVFSSGQPTENRELPVLADGGAGATVLADRGPILVRGFDQSAPQEFRRGDMNPERITLNDTNDPAGTFLPLADVRDRFTSPIRAVVDYNFGGFKFLVANRPALADGKLKPEVTRTKDRDELAVASYNVENLDGLDPQERYDRVAAQIVGNLRAPDILSLEEIQDNDGAASPAPTAADVTYTRLIAAIKAAGGPTYEYRQVDPAPASDGGEPGGNIRVAFLYRTDNRDLRFVDRGTATATTPTEPVEGAGGRPQLTLSPGRVDPTNPVFNNSRKPLAAEFSYRGKPLFLVGNHFASKGGDDPVFGRFQEPRRPSELQRRGSATDPADTTRGQAGVVNTFVKKILDIDPRAHVLVLGDLNDFDFSETVHVLEQGADERGVELVDLWRFVPQDERYSYVFQGNGQVLDHILASPWLLLQRRPDLDAVHINAEFSDQASDHDPPITRLGGG
jgi:uncharacterized protein